MTGSVLLSATAKAALTENQRAIVVAVIAGLVAVIVAILGAVAAYFANKREHRRLTYSQAIRAATAWKELLYRVRRRREGEAAAIIELFHQAQDELSFYQAWVGAESKYMARSYQRLVAAVKAATDDLIRQAWKDAIRPLPGDATEGDVHPSLDEAVGAFLHDVRSHLSPWPWRKFAMVWRNRKGA